MRKLLSLILLLAMLSTVLVVPSAKGMVTSLGLAEHGLKAYNDKWVYQYGGKGQVVNGHRVSDCSGLIYAYFSDNGVSGCYGGCTGQVSNNCIFSSKLDGKIPNIHGLVVTMYDTVAPETGIYGHIGIYIGAGLVCDNSTYGTNMVKAGVFSRNWTEWHLFNLGVQYPVKGWYIFDNKMVYYQDYEYLTNTDKDGYHLNNEGFAINADGSYAKVDNSILSHEYASAEEVKRNLIYKGYQNNGGMLELFKDNALVTGDSVRLRSSANTYSSVVDVLGKNAKVMVLEEVTGETISSNSKTSNIWYKLKTQMGKIGYMSSIFVLRTDTETKLNAPMFSYDKDIGIFITCDDPNSDSVNIYYTTDGTIPSEDSGTLYFGPIQDLGCTIKAICTDGRFVSPVAELTITSSGAIFSDFNYNAWYANQIDEAVSLGLFSGIGNNRFDPRSSITRGQFVIVLSRLAGIDLSSYDGTTDFSDVPSDAYYSKAVDWAKDIGIISGIGSNRFAPNSPITREQVCAILARYLNWNSPEDYNSFSDDEKISSWAKDAVYACKYNGVVSGVGSNSFNPRSNLTRAEGATIAVNSYKFF